MVLVLVFICELDVGMGNLVGDADGQERPDEVVGPEHLHNQEGGHHHDHEVAQETHDLVLFVCQALTELVDVILYCRENAGVK